jgi:hypothetical protein
MEKGFGGPRCKEANEDGEQRTRTRTRMRDEKDSGLQARHSAGHEFLALMYYKIHTYLGTNMRYVVHVLVFSHGY